MLSSVGRCECGELAGGGGDSTENKSYSGGKTLLSESFSTSPRGREGGEESVDACLSVCACVCVCVCVCVCARVWRKSETQRVKPELFFVIGNDGRAV